MKKKFFICLICLWGIWVGSYFFIRIELTGDTKLTIKKDEPYEELGAKASFFGKNLSIQMTDNVNTKKSGVYYVCYQVRNQFGISRYKKRKIIVLDEISPEIKLRGAKYLVLTVGDRYVEPGYSAIDNVDGTITKKVKVKGKVDTKKSGTYMITYQVTDQTGNTSEEKRTVRILEKEFKYQNNYDKIDNTLNGWWTDNKKDHKRPKGGYDEKELKKYDAYFMGKDEKKIYLTFDEGSNDTYISEILDVLKEKRVKATFFLCHNYIVHNEKVLMRMIKEGHIVGNHTADHKQMPKLSTKETYQDFLNQVKKNEEAFYKITGSYMAKVYREPAGEWSKRSLKMISDLGYRSYFWSADHYDFAHTLTKEVALKQLLQKYHNGAIYLLHPKNKGNYEALGDFIDQMKELGYDFGLVDEIGNES